MYRCVRQGLHGSPVWSRLGSHQSSSFSSEFPLDLLMLDQPRFLPELPYSSGFWHLECLQWKKLSLLYTEHPSDHPQDRFLPEYLIECDQMGCSEVISCLDQL